MMRNKIRFLVCLLALVFCLNLYAQKRPLTVLKKPDKSQDVFNPQDYQEWKKVDLRNYSFYLPKNFKLKEIKGIDALVREYKDSEYSLNIIEGPYAPSSSVVGKKIEHYRRGSFQIEEIQAHIWSYKDSEEEYPYCIGIRFNPPNSVVMAIAIILDSKDEKGQEIGKKIFKSIQFKKIQKKIEKPD